MNENEGNMKQQPPPPPPQKCPRCDSLNTKFCYYNNYSLAQPRYFCKACRRYWTHGGTLRNVPIGGGCRKAKRPKTFSPSSSSSNVSTVRSLPVGSQSYPGLDSGRAFTGLLDTIIPGMAAVRPLPAGTNQGSAMSLISGGQFSANTAVLQGANASSSFNQNLTPNWIMNSGPTTHSSAGSFTFWSGTTNCNGSHGGAQAGSINPNQWLKSDYNNKF